MTTPVCITTHGWYSEECSSIPPLVFCGGGTTVECMTRFSRVLSFASCPGVTSPPGIVDCLVITVKVSLNGEDVVTLNQILTRS